MQTSPTAQIARIEAAFTRIEAALQRRSTTATAAPDVRLHVRQALSELDAVIARVEAGGR